MKDILSTVAVVYKCRDNNASCDFSGIDVGSQLELSEGNEVEALPKELFS